jgi:transposase-like protein
MPAPVIIPKGQTRFTGFDDKIISLYSRGMTTREIQGRLEDPDLVTQMRANVHLNLQQKDNTGTA